ncbi:trigger factor-related chaperone [Mycoplasma sp. VS509_3]|uniref:trigger factor-related chaperone n=2 Tax=unclassified Mycoplasma TaxID=2683645 RepID=UPI003AAEBA1F
MKRGQMQFETKHININKEEWINAQHQALSQLERNKKEGQKIEQSLILETAAHNLLTFYRNTELQSNNDLYKDRIYFLPIASNVKFSIEEMSFDLKTYYQDKLDEFNLEVNPNVEFKMPDDFSTRVDLFTQNFIQKYRFKIQSSKETVEAGDNVEFKIWPSQTPDQAEKYNAVANLESKNPIEQALVGLKVNQVQEIEAFGTKFTLEVLMIFSYQEMPITDLNVHLLNIPNIKSLADVKTHIYDVTQAQTVNDEIFSYGEKIMSSILEMNKGKLVIPEDLIENDIKAFEFSAEFKGDKREVVVSTIENYFWTILAMKKFNFIITQEDVDSEYKKLSAIIPADQLQQIGGQRLSNIILFKKIGTIYLQKHQTNEFNKFEKILKNYFVSK